MLKQRVFTAIILVVLFLAALFTLPASGWTVLVALIIWQGAVEWARLSNLSGNMRIVYCAASLLLLLGTLWLDRSPATGEMQLPHLFFYGTSVLMWVLVVPAWMYFAWQPKNKWLLALVGWIVLIPTGLAMIDLHVVGAWWLLGAMSVVWLADTAAYFSGRKFGKHKLAPSISPGKTWEGVVGALMLVTIYVAAIGWETGLIKSFPVFAGVIMISIFWVALSVIGDLFESAIKRQAGVKDSGSLLPGHGGLLDRIDALTSTLPFVALILMIQKFA